MTTIDHTLDDALDYTPEALEAAGRVLTGRGPVHMLNLLRYRDQADYGARPDSAPCAGREAYFQRYVPAFGRVAQQVAPGAEVAVRWVGHVRATLVAPSGEAWDDVALVAYPSFEVLRRILESPAYAAEAAPHRRAALAAWRFLATLEAGPPGS